MGWTYLLLAGLFEVGFTTCLKLSDGFTRLWPTLGFFAFSIASFTLLTFALKTIPLGTAYAVWTGVGAFGTALVSLAFFERGRPINPWQVALLLTLIGSVIGLKAISPE
jgi:quaternary ammonium compound-resistance protein SugE